MLKKSLLLLLVLLSPAGIGELISTPRLTISLMGPGDWPFYSRLMTDERVMKNANGIFTPEMTKTLFEQGIAGNEALARKAKSISNSFLLTTKAGQPIGFILIERGPGGYWETSTILDPPFWGGRLGTEARAALTGFFFEKMNVSGLVSTVAVNNVPSTRLARSLGYSLAAKNVMSPDRRAFTRDISIPWNEYRLSKRRYLQLAETRCPEYRFLAED